MAAGLCSSRLLSSSPRVFSPTLEESGDEELSVLPRHTKVVVTGNNRTKSVLIGLQGVVKKAVGLGGWHWLVLKNGVEVKLQRNALSVLEPPTGNEDDNDENELDNSLCSSSDREYSSIEFQKPSKSRARHTRPWPPLIKSTNHNSHNRAIQAPPCNVRTNVNLAKLGTASLWRYWKHFNLVSINPNPSKEQLVNTVHHHFVTQEQLDEMQVILGFIHKAKRLKTLDH